LALSRLQKLVFYQSTETCNIATNILTVTREASTHLLILINGTEISKENEKDFTERGREIANLVELAQDIVACTGC
jgi:hypothetical protein